MVECVGGVLGNVVLFFKLCDYVLFVCFVFVEVLWYVVVIVLEYNGYMVCNLDILLIGCDIMIYLFEFELVMKNFVEVEVSWGGDIVICMVVE